MDVQQIVSENVQFKFVSIGYTVMCIQSLYLQLSDVFHPSCSLIELSLSSARKQIVIGISVRCFLKASIKYLISLLIPKEER